MLSCIYSYTCSIAHQFAVVGLITLTFNFRRCAKSMCELISSCENNNVHSCQSSCKHVLCGFFSIIFPLQFYYKLKSPGTPLFLLILFMYVNNNNHLYDFRFDCWSFIRANRVLFLVFSNQVVALLL